MLTSHGSCTIATCQGDVVPGRNAWPRPLLHASDWRGQGAQAPFFGDFGYLRGAGKRSSIFFMKFNKFYIVLHSST